MPLPDTKQRRSDKLPPTAVAFTSSGWLSSRTAPSTREAPARARTSPAAALPALRAAMAPAASPARGRRCGAAAARAVRSCCPWSPAFPLRFGYCVVRRGLRRKAREWSAIHGVDDWTTPQWHWRARATAGLAAWTRVVESHGVSPRRSVGSGVWIQLEAKIASALNTPADPSTAAVVVGDPDPTC